MFHNWREFAALCAGEAAPSWQFCAPRLEEGSPELAAIRRSLLARVDLFHRFTDDPDVHLLVDGTVVGAQLVANHRFYRFAVPAAARTLAIASHSTVPAAVGLAEDDTRGLASPSNGSCCGAPDRASRSAMTAPP